MSIMIYNLRFWYKISNYITISGVRHLHRCPKVKTNFATYPKLGHGPKTLSRTRPQFDNSSVIIAGDWNVVQDYRVDTLNYIGENNPKSKLEINQMINNMDLVDV